MPDADKAAALLRELEDRNRDLQELTRTLENRVTERTTELSTSNKDLEAFAYSVSHDLRAPLRHIAGFAQLLASSAHDKLDTQERTYLARIEQSVQRMDQLINALLEFSRVGRAEISTRQIDLDAVVDDAWHQVKPKDGGRVIEFRRHALPRVNGDLQLMRQVFVTLLSNAVKYTRNQAATLIEVGARSDSGTPVVYVKDNGVGFDPVHASRLFTAFQRLHTHAEFEGSGVGLATAYRIITRHGGRIWAEAAPSAGATFYVALPAG